MLMPDYIIKDRPIKQQQHILESMIFGLQSAFPRGKMPASAKEMETKMLNQYYSLEK
jgi:hypothetical protein